MSLSASTVRKIKRWFRNRRRFLFASFAAFFLSALYAFASSIPSVKSFELAAIDNWFALRGRVSAPPDVVIAAIDDRSYFDLKANQGQPWPRRTNTQLLKQLSKAGAKRAIFDIFFVDDSPNPEVDREMSEALSLLPTFIGAYKTLLSSQDRALTEVRPIELFAKKAEAIADMRLLSGGPVRHFFVSQLKKVRDGTYPILPLCEAIVSVSPVPLQLPDKRDLILYYGPPGTFPSFSISNILKMTDEQLTASFKDKTVMIGSQLKVGILLSLKDAFITPVSSTPMAGVEIHATAVANILSQRWIRRFPKEMEDASTGVLTFFISFFILLLRPRLATALAAVTIGTWIASSYWVFFHGYLLPGRGAALVVLPSALLLSVSYFYLILRSQVDEMNSALGTDF